MPDLDPASDDFYDLVVVGRGYSASTYLFTADLSWCNKILIIAGPDAWEHIVRGDGIVNHANYIYARDNPDVKFHPDPKAPEGNKAALKDENAAIIAKATGWLGDKCKPIVNGVVTEISKKTYILANAIERTNQGTRVFKKNKADALNAYSIIYDVWNKPLGDEEFDADQIVTKTVRSLKVVYCGGAGPQADFYNYDRKTKNLQFPTETFMDLDSFMRSDPKKIKPAIAGTSAIALLGPNAGVDAAVEALNRKFKLYWLISGPQDSNPAWLSTKHYTIDDKTGQEAIDDANKNIVNYPKDNRPSFKFENNLYEITFPHKDSQIQAEVWRRKDEPQKFKSFEALYVVYATGQDPNAQEVISGTDKPWRIGPAKVLNEILKQEKLTPIYDINQRFSSWYESTLGLKDSDYSRYTGLEVLGASALALANFKKGDCVKQAYFTNSGAAKRALDVCLQPGSDINKALKAIQNSSWNDHSDATRLYDYFDARNGIPAVATSMAAIIPKLYQQTLIAADQLGVVKSQIEALTGFDIIAASTDTHEWIVKASAVQQASQQIKKAIENLSRQATENDLKPLKDAVATYNTAETKFGEVDQSVNDAAAECVALLSQEDREVLNDEGFEPDRFAFEINWAVWNLSFAIRWLSYSDNNYLNQRYQQGVLKEIPDVQRQLTNLQAIFQASTTGNIQSAINFNSMDRTQLAVLLAAKYPAILATDWRPITAQILEGRRFSPWGYKPEQVDKIEEWLAAVNKGTKSVNEFPDLVA